MPIAPLQDQMPSFSSEFETIFFLSQRNEFLNCQSTPLIKIFIRAIWRDMKHWTEAFHILLAVYMSGANPANWAGSSYWYLIVPLKLGIK